MRGFIWWGCFQDSGKRAARSSLARALYIYMFASHGVRVYISTRVPPRESGRRAPTRQIFHFERLYEPCRNKRKNSESRARARACSRFSALFAGNRYSSCIYIYISWRALLSRRSIPSARIAPESLRDPSILGTRAYTRLRRDFIRAREHTHVLQTYARRDSRETIPRGTINMPQQVDA